MRGLRCSVYVDKHLGDCSNRGISSVVETVTLVGPGIPEIFEPRDDSPAVKLVRRDIGGEYLHVEPEIEHPENETPYMFGGAFIYTCDSRFPSKYPIPLHDRSETWDQYNLNSR